MNEILKNEILIKLIKKIYAKAKNNKCDVDNLDMMTIYMVDDYMQKIYLEEIVVEFKGLRDLVNDYINRDKNIIHLKYNSLDNIFDIFDIRMGIIYLVLESITGIDHIKSDYDYLDKDDDILGSLIELCALVFRIYEIIKMTYDDTNKDNETAKQLTQELLYTFCKIMHQKMTKEKYRQKFTEDENIYFMYCLICFYLHLIINQSCIIIP